MTTLRKLSAAAAVLAWFIAPGHALAATGCGTSVASLHGWYGMLITGGNLSSGTAKYQVGALLFDGVGGVSGSNVYGAAGSHSAVSGTYVQNADCTLTIDLTIGSTPSVFTVAVASNGQAVGIEADAAAVANITLKPQYATYTSGLNFGAASLNGTFAASCSGPLSASSDVNLVTFANGSLTGTDPFNNAGTFVAANVPYTGTYTVNTDGTFGGSLLVEGTTFDFYGVLSTENTQADYIYEDVSNGKPIDAFAACLGGAALASSTTTAPFTLTPAASTLTLKQNAGGTDAITVTPASGFTGSVALSVSGLPAGASAAFSGSTLVVFPALTTVVGTYPLTITGTSGASTATTTVSLVITPAATFTLAPASGTVTVARGKSSTDAISVAAVNGFSSSVAFSATGLPAGVSASFSPTSSTSGTTVTFAATASATPGTYPVTIAGAVAGTGNSNAFTVTSSVSVVVQ
jgi:hypothetical protein